MVDCDLPYRSIDKDHNHYDEWHQFWVQQLATTPIKRQEQVVNYDLQTQVNSFIGLCDSMLRCLRVYVLATGDHALLGRFEADVQHVSVQLKEKILSLRGRDRTNAIVVILAVATQSIALDIIVKKQNFQRRLSLGALCRALEELEHTIDGQTKSTLSPVVLQVTSLSTKPSSLTIPTRIGDHRAAVARSQTRNAIGLVVAAFMGIALVRVATASDSEVPVTHPIEDSYPRYPAPPETLYRPASFIRHTGTVIDPVRPHQSIVYPSLVRFFDANQSQLQQCFVRNTVSITNVAELARWISDNHDHRVHNMMERLSRKPDKHFTVWWTDDCSEMVFATGIRTDFLTGEIRPQPVTLMMPVRE